MSTATLTLRTVTYRRTGVAFAREVYSAAARVTVTGAGFHYAGEEMTLGELATRHAAAKAVGPVVWSVRVGDGDSSFRTLQSVE